MEKITFECETITPMFLAGADGQRPELRAPSIKGALRFWWRAMRGEMPPHLILEKETQLFGGIGKDNSGQKSKVRIKTKVLKQKVKNPPDRFKYSGVNYLLYSTYLNNRQAFYDLRFELTLTSFDSDALENAIKAFWLLENLGGLGTRNRRGGGSFKVGSVTPNETWELLSPNYSNLDTFSNHFSSYLDKLKKENHVKSLANTTYCNFSGCSIYVIPERFSSALDALDYLGIEFQDFRSRRSPDYDIVKDFIQNGTINSTVERSAFGLPLSFRYRSLNNDSANIEPSDKDTNRSASSILLRVTKINNSFYPLIINFNRELLPVSETIKISSRPRQRYNKGGTAKISQPNQIIKQDFIDGLNTIKII